MPGRWTSVATSVFLGASAVAFAALMFHSETTIPIPVPGEKTTLTRLEYRARFVASIDAVTLELASPDGDPVIVQWTFLGSNTDGQAHRVEIVLRVLDEGGAQIGTFTKRAVLPAAAAGLPVTFSTKLKPDVWKAARKVRISADWMS